MTIQADGLPDDRAHCEHCRHLVSSEKRHYCRAFAYEAWRVPVRCVKYIPIASQPDQRTGAERWPTIKKEIDEARAIDRGGSAK